MEKSRSLLMANDSRPYRKQARTYLQGTLLKIFEYHVERNGLTNAEYLRGLVRSDLTQKYDIHPVKGVVKMVKS